LEDDMVHFFGIFDPGKFRRAPADEAPAKASLFRGSKSLHRIATATFRRAANVRKDFLSHGQNLSGRALEKVD